MSTLFPTNYAPWGMMASFAKHKNGWRAQIAKQGVRASKVLPTKREAQDWAARREYEIANARQIASRQTFGEIMNRYANEVSPRKRGERWEGIRLKKLGKDRIAKVAISDLTAADLADWRDRRLREVSAGSVIREMTLLGAVLTQARREWGLIAESPMRDVRRPAQPARRSRLVTQDELDRLQHSAGSDLDNATARACHAFMLAIETGMRAGEILGLTSDTVDLKRRVAHLPKTKNGEARDVPLSTEAVRLVQALLDHELGGETIFNLTSAQLDALWRKLRDRAAVTELTFHDSRHTAITRLSRRLDPLALARMVGHRDLKMLLRYYDETAEELAKRLG